MNLLLLTAEDFVSSGRAEIRGRRLQHLNKILRASAGQNLVAGMLNGNKGQAVISSINKSVAILDVTLMEEPPPPFPCTLILALPRPLMVKRILQSVTSLGIKEIHLIQSEKVEKSYWNSSDLAEEVLHDQLILGLEQGVDTQLPKVFLHPQFKTFCHESLSTIASNKKSFLLHPGDYEPCPANMTDACVLALGPEGGFTTKEVDTFLSYHFKPVQLGARVLRVETAVSVALGKLLPC